MIQKIPLFGPVLDQFWGPFWGQKLLQKGTKNGTTFGTTSLRISGVRTALFQELYERCAKAIGIGIILSKRKGGIYTTCCGIAWSCLEKEKQRNKN